MSSPALARELEVAIAAVCKAARVCVSVQQARDLGSVSKDDKSPVTIADFASQAVIIEELKKSFEHPIVAEEDADRLRQDNEEARTLKQRILEAVQLVLPQAKEDDVLFNIDSGRHPGGSSGTFWALDPIDGTKGFIRGGQYAVALGLVQDGKPVLGVLGCPNLPENIDEPEGKRGFGFAAVQGQGAFMFPLDDVSSRVPIKASTTDKASDMVFAESYESGHAAHDKHKQISDMLGAAKQSKRLDSQAKYALLARGDADTYLRLPREGAKYQEKIWDHVAGVALVEAAGCKVADANGKPLNFACGRTLAENQGVVVTNGHLHDAVITAVASVMKPSQ